MEWYNIINVITPPQQIQEGKPYQYFFFISLFSQRASTALLMFHIIHTITIPDEYLSLMNKLAYNSY